MDGFFYTVAKKLNNIVVLQSWNGLNLQQEKKLENNPFMQTLMKSAIPRMVDKVE